MGFDLMQMLGLKQKRPDLGPMMRAPLAPQLTEFPTGKSLNEIILAGLQGKGVGFDPSFVSRTTSPVVAQREAGWKERELPFITGEMSARGLGRSTIAGEGLRRGFETKERDINQILSEAYRASEMQKKADEARYQQLGMGFAGTEAQIGGARAAEESRRAGVEIGTEQAAQAGTQQNINRLIASALAVGTAPFTGGASLATLPGIWGGGGGGQVGTSDMSTLLDFLKKGQATPFTGQMTGGGTFMAGGKMRQIPSVPIPTYAGG